MQAALNAALAELPIDLPSRPTFRKANPAASPVLILALTSRTITGSAIYDAADSVLVQRLSQVPGVADVTVAGSEQPAIRVRMNPGALAAAGISLEDVRNAINNANVVTPLGSFENERLSETIATNEQMRDIPDYHGIVVKSANGTVVRPDTVVSWAREAGFDHVEVLPIEHAFWRFFRLSD